MNQQSRTDEGLFDKFFHTMMTVPSEYFYVAAIGSIVTSAALYAFGKRHTALFVGQWAPTFLVSALFYKLLHPAHDVSEGIRQTVGDLTR
jgi:hypothetical protein